MGVHLLCRLFTDSVGIDLFIQVRRAQTHVAASAMFSLIFHKKKTVYIGANGKYQALITILFSGFGCVGCCSTSSYC